MKSALICAHITKYMSLCSLDFFCAHITDWNIQTSPMPTVPSPPIYIKYKICLYLTYFFYIFFIINNTIIIIWLCRKKNLRFMPIVNIRLVLARIHTHKHTDSYMCSYYKPEIKTEPLKNMVNSHQAPLPPVATRHSPFSIESSNNTFFFYNIYVAVNL